MYLNVYLFLGLFHTHLCMFIHLIRMCLSLQTMTDDV